MDALVTTHELAAQLGSPGLHLLDATWFGTLGAEGRDAATEFAAGHIPGAAFLDLGHLSQAAVEGATAGVARLLGALGIDDGATIVLYDDSPYHSAARAWWLLKRYGVAASLLDGGIAKWRAEGRPLQTGHGAAHTVTRHLHFDPSRMRTKADVRGNLDSGAEQLLDARSAARFTGAELDPRGLPTGHIPGSFNLPYGKLFATDGTWKRGEALRAGFEDSGVDLDRPIVTTCGSGVTAAVLAFGLHLLGRDAALYDGSWTDWASDPTTPKATVTL
ncbi:sulfurtransferase [Sphingomonas sp. MJ1 (PH-R8)]|uniref:sulfurtransferase n=1 Tax=Sphingomonas sp. MJ1 (PH-R8) TaxID=3112950 RepID=UPI003A845316